MDILFNNAIFRSFIEKFVIEMSKGAVVKLKELHISSDDKKVAVSLLLLGEEAPVVISVEGYRFEEGNVLFIQEITTSKAWITRVLKSLLAAKDNRIKLPDSLVSTLLQKMV